jgi:organic radical activating enzyme
MTIPENFCMAPWVHAMHDTQYVRKACCTAEISTDQATRTAKDFEDFQNSNHMKEIRKSLMNNKIPADCFQCDVTVGNVNKVNLFKDFWNTYYSDYYEDAMSKTLPDGSTTFKPVYYDYRFGKTCNFKCRHCSSSSSSLIELEERNNNLEHANQDDIIEDSDERNQILYKELMQAAEERRLKAVQWIGGEPLFVQQHWDFMNHLYETNNTDISVSYITNLSIIKFKGINLVDILEPFSGVAIHASCESGGLAAEYIRRGLNWDKWKSNFTELNKHFKQSQAQGKNRNLGSGLTITIFTLCGFKEWLEFIIEQDLPTHDITIVKPNENNRYLCFDYLGSYKDQWVTEFANILDSYKSQLKESIANDLYSALELVKQHSTLDISGLDLTNLNDNRVKQLRRSFAYANKIDSIDQYPTTQDVIKDYPFLQEWWNNIQSKL